MYDIHSQEFKYHYQRSKLKVKQWEDQFKAENGRIPTKADIKTSSIKIRHYYKIYWKLKTLLLEETILGDSLLNETANPVRCRSDNVLKEHTNIIEEKSAGLTKPGSALLMKDVLKENKNSLDSLNGKTESKTWGLHLNKVVSSPLETVNSNFLNSTVSERLFEGSKFKKRNPRKALNRNISNTSVSSLDSINKTQSNVSFTSTETFGSADSFQATLSPCPDDVTGNAPCSVEKECSPKVKALIMSKTELSPIFAASKFRVVQEKQVTHSQPVSLTQRLVKEPKEKLELMTKIDPGWLDRCSDAIKADQQTSKPSSDSGFESMESSLLGSEPDGKEATVVPESDDEDDIIADSDNENDFRSNFLAVKRKSEDANVSLSISSQSEPPVEQVSKKMKLDPYAFPVDAGKKPDTKVARLEKKMKAGTLNENFVRINIKKKVYVRGKKNFNFSKHKKQQWKNLKKKLDEGEGGAVRCFKCGDAGHYARYCQKINEKVKPEDLDSEEEESTLPTLEEAAAMAREKANPKKNVLPAVPEVQPDTEEPFKKVEPLYGIDVTETPWEVHEALMKFGHANFRPGQEKAIMRILSGLSTLVTIATGGGKSLCYQLPAYLYATKKLCITLVVSPLVSLMEDQVSGSSSFFKLGCLHTNQTLKQRQAVLEDAKNGKLHALLVSPEAIVAGDNSSGLCSTLKSLPPIAFACIDEVHCLSQWSHNFRPSYLMLTKVLKEKLGVTTVLGLTATATKSTIGSITKELDITDESGVIKDIPVPDNLCLSISREENKDKALLDLLKGPRFKDANAILIYCTKRDECERLAVLIRTLLNDSEMANKSKRLSWNAESYHAGMSSARRKQVQKAFMKGNLRIVVATIAFGMGINKQDIRGVIHYNMPKDFESYVQEVGRAGRDGMMAHCHLFLDKDGRDLNELRRHIYSNAVDRHVLRKLLQRVFVECKCKDSPCPGHEVAFDISETVQALDLPEENIYTLLCYLELHPGRLIKVLSPGFMNCKIQSYRGWKAIVAAANSCPPLAFACALHPDQRSGNMNFNVIEVSNAISWDSGSVKNRLKKIEWFQTKDEKWKKSGIAVDFSGLGFRVVSRGNMSGAELDEALQCLIERVENQEKRSCEQLEIIFSAVTHFSEASHAEEYNKEKSDLLKSAIREYFEDEKLSDRVPLRKVQAQDFDEDEISSDIRSLICNYRDHSFNGRAVARIFHGIQSPNYPASTWYKCRHWRQHIDKDFNKICRIATKEILRLK